MSSDNLSLRKCIDTICSESIKEFSGVATCILSYNWCSSLNLFSFSKPESEDEGNDITLQEMSLDSALELDEGHDDKRQTTGEQEKGSILF